MVLGLHEVDRPPLGEGCVGQLHDQGTRGQRGLDPGREGSVAAVLRLEPFIVRDVLGGGLVPDAGDDRQGQGAVEEGGGPGPGCPPPRQAVQEQGHGEQGKAADVHAHAVVAADERADQCAEQEAQAPDSGQ